MSKEYRRKLHAQGGSLLISVPKVWTRSEGLTEGDEVVIRVEDSSEELHVFPCKESKD